MKITQMIKRFWVLFNRRTPKAIPYKVVIERPEGQRRWDKLEELLCNLPMAAHYYSGGDDFLYAHLVPKTEWMLAEFPPDKLPVTIKEVSSELEKAGFRVRSTQQLA